MSQRYLARVAATFLARSQSTAFLTEYVTATGVFVRTDSPPEPMELLRIEFILPPESTKVILHGMVTNHVPLRTKHAAPGVEIGFFAKAGDASGQWDRFIDHLRDNHPESLTRPVLLARARDATDQVRRAHPRLVPRSPIEIEAEGTGFTVGDISDGGMFIETDEDAFAVGSDLRITLHDPRTNTGIPVDCVVRRRAVGANSGIGVEFRNMDDERRRVLRDLMASAGGADSVPRLLRVHAHCEEILAPSLPRRMETLPGPGFFGGQAGSLAGLEDSWAGLGGAPGGAPEDGWPSL